MPGGLVIRSMRVDDVPAVRALILDVFARFNAAEYGDHPERFTGTVTPLALAQMQAEELVLVAESGGVLAGVIAILGGTHLELLFVDGALHRRGLGRALWAAALARLDAEDPPPAEITVKSSDHAQGFYERLGFVPLGSRRREVRPLVWRRPGR